MRTIAPAAPLILCLAIAPACKKAGEPAPTHPAAHPADYAMCGGQRLPEGAAPPRRGPVELQLAPAFLDHMAACRAESGPPHDVIAKADDGTVNDKGHCEYALGVSCHYHAGAEFIHSSTTQQTPGRGELHCIFPGADPKSPAVYGGHVVCRGAGHGKVHGGPAPSHEVKAGASCPDELLEQLRSCQAFRCCDDGTLTNPIADLVREGRHDIRPDFRICSDAIEIDCELLANLTPHHANSPALGGVGAPVFSGGRKP